jgi:hypothetical protein
MPFGHNRLERGGFAYGEAEPGRPFIATIEFGGSTVPDDTPLDTGRRFADLMHQAHLVLPDLAGGRFAESAQEWRDRVEVVIAGAARWPAGSAQPAGTHGRRHLAWRRRSRSHNVCLGPRRVPKWAGPVGCRLR